MINCNISRESAYEIVQRNAMKAWKNKGDFLEQLKSDPEVTKIIKEEEIEKLFDYSYHLKHVDEIFLNVFHKED